VVTPIWLTAFIDVPADEHARALAFWCAVTGHRLAPHEGDSEEYATLYPADADPHLRVQRLGDGPARVHVDLHHPDQSFRVLSSPAGLPYCEVYAVRQRRARPIKWPQGHHSAVDQLCIDIAPSRFEEECEFWSERTGWPVKGFTEHPEFRRWSARRSSRSGSFSSAWRTSDPRRPISTSPATTARQRPGGTRRSVRTSYDVTSGGRCCVTRSAWSTASPTATPTPAWSGAPVRTSFASVPA